ncbi:MAG: hypothetical protein ABI577_11545 [bacterium]
MSDTFNRRFAALCGVSFALLLFVGVASINVPHSVSDQEMIDWWSKGGNQSASILSMYALTASAIALVVFLSHLRDRLNSAEANAGNAMFALGLAASVMQLASSAAHGVIGNAVKVNDEPLPGVDALRFIPQLSYTFMDLALISAGACVVLASVAIRRTATLPAWLAWLGFVSGALLIVGTVVIGPLTIPILLIWAVAASVALLRSAPAEATAPRRVSAVASAS